MKDLAPLEMGSSVGETRTRSGLFGDIDSTRVPDCQSSSEVVPPRKRCSFLDERGSRGFLQNARPAQSRAELVVIHSGAGKPHPGF